MLSSRAGVRTGVAAVEPRHELREVVRRAELLHRITQGLEAFVDLEVGDGLALVPLHDLRLHEARPCNHRQSALDTQLIAESGTTATVRVCGWDGLGAHSPR